MRTKLVVVLVLLALIVAGASAASASDVSWFGLIGTGTDQQEVSARMSLRTTSGSPVGSNDYVVSLSQGEGLRAQVVFAGDGGPGRYQVEWSCLGAPGDRYNKADYFDNAGYVFEIPAFTLSTMVDTPFHLRVKDLKGKSEYIRLLFFTVVTGRRAVAAHEALFIRVEPAPQPAIAEAQAAPAPSQVVADPKATDENFARIQEAIEALNANDVKLVEDLNANGQRNGEQDARLERLEEWVTVASSQQPVNIPAPQTQNQQTFCWTLTGLPASSYLLEMIESGKLRSWQFGPGSSTLEFPDAMGSPSVRVRVNSGAWKALSLTGPCVVNIQSLQEAN